MTGLASIVRRSKMLTALYYMADDWRAGRRLAAGRLETGSGARHEALDVAASVSYIDRVWDDYLLYAGRPHFGAVVAEIGPGDNFGVATMALLAGAREVHCIDRYRPRRDPNRHAAIYRALAERGASHLFDGAPSETSLRGVVYHAGAPAETFFKDKEGRFDGIVSRAVMEHLYDPVGALDDMARALKAGGVLTHRVDLRDHGMFAGRHPLTFFTIPDAIYRRMTRNAGRPNRMLAPAYRDWLARSGLVGHVRITRLAGVAGEFPALTWEQLPEAARRQALACVAEIRGSLAGALRNLASEDLAISGIVLCAEKH